MHNSSRLPVGHSRRSYHPSAGFGIPTGRLSGLPRSGSSSVFHSLEAQRTTSTAEVPLEYGKMAFRGGHSNLRSTSSMLPAPPGFGLPRANERRIRDDCHEASDTSLHSSSDDDFDEDEEDAADGHADGNPPGERKVREIKPMQPIASMANFSKLSSTAANQDSSSNFSDLWGKSASELLANNAAMGAAGGQSAPLSSILRALFPNWFANVMLPPAQAAQPPLPGMWSPQPLPNPGLPYPWASPGQYSPYYGPSYGPYGSFPPGPGFR